jgi:hypothetical protein
MPTISVQLAIVIPLVAFLLLAVVFAILLRRLGRLLATTRKAESFKNGLAEIVRRVDSALMDVVGQVDSVRRHQLEPSLVLESLATAREATDGWAEEVAKLSPPTYSHQPREGIVAEIGRAGRAIEMIEHGCDLLMTMGGPAIELEAQTSIKRGYLNLIHAREAIVRLAAEAATAGPPPPRSLFSRSDHTM